MNTPDPEYGETWAYESIVGALPGVEVSTRLALALQFVAFEAGVLALGFYYGLPQAAVAGTITVAVATVGSFAMLHIARQIRALDVPEGYSRLLFGSSVEVVLAILAYVALVTHLFVFDPRTSATPLLQNLLGPEPPVLAVYLLLLVLWDVCYRIGTGWWASVAALWRSLRYEFDPDTARALRRTDLETIGFGLLQLALLPLLLEYPVLVVVLVGHTAAVVLVSGAAAARLGFSAT
jgi:hypothetical protein